MVSTVGNSSSHLEKKLGIKQDFRINILNPPDHYFDLFYQLPPVVMADEGEELDFIHMFCTNFNQLETYYNSVIGHLRKKGILWISWPKKTSTIASELDRDSIRTYVLQRGLVDTKVCAVDKDWSGLKFMYRTKDR